jgi:peptidyl-prolyl cis-trans isomerase SurA
MKRIAFQVWLVSFCFSAVIVTAQSPNDVLLTIGKRSVTAGEFERIYNKNYNINTAEKQTVNEYFDLFLKFKLKVFAALDANLDTLSSFKKELKGYRDQLAKNYLTDTKAVDSLVREAYDHTINDVNVSHILVLFPENPNAADTLACYNKILGIQKKLQAGESFEKLAEQYSEDPSVKTNKGNLGYFSAFRFPYLFESCAYNTKVGKVSQILRVGYGYHLIKVNDKRPSPGEVKVAHIMALVPRNSPDSIWAKARTKIDKIYERVTKGEDFGKLAKELSEDRASAGQEGELAWFGTGRMVPEFETASFALKTKGDISKPIKTAYGWHIIKLLEKRGVPSFDQVKNEYKTKIASDEREDIIVNAFVTKLKKQNPHKILTANLSPFYTADSTIYKGKVNLKKEALDKPLLIIQKTTYTGADFKKYLEANPIIAKKTSVKEYIDQSFNKFLNNTFIKFEDQNLETKYSDFGNLINEYHDGILLFDIMDRQVWSKASHDSAGLASFYQQMKDKPVWSERLDAGIFTCKTKEIADKVKKLAADPTNKKLTDTQIIKSICDSTVGYDCVMIERRLFSKSDNKLIDSIAWKPGIADLPLKDGKVSFVYVWGTRAPETKNLEEVKGLITADYQNYLEEKWIGELKNKYKVVVNQDLLHKIADKYKNAH